MAYLGIAFLFAIVFFIQLFEDKSCKKQNGKIEALHTDAYKWVDEHVSDLAVAREYKAEIDTMINDCVEHNGRTYKASELKQVTTKKERKARDEALIRGERYVSSDMAFALIASEIHGKPTAEEMWEHTEHTDDEKREHFIECLMSKLGISRDEATQRADKLYASVKEN